jgi:NAD(P) transhydrogenase
MERFDVVVFGTGPAGHYGAIQAAKLGKKVAAVEQHDRVGGVSATLGTIPSKALREATLHLTGLRQRSFYGMNYRVKDDITVQDLVGSTAQIIRNETSVFEAQLRRNNVRLIRGKGQFQDQHHIEVKTPHGPSVLEADLVLLAVGSSPAHPPDMPFDGHKVLDSNQILNLTALPKRLVVVGAGIIGMEYACIFSALGTSVTVVDQRNDLLEFADRQIIDTLRFHMQSRDVEFRLGEEVVRIEQQGHDVVAHTRSNKQIRAECLLYSIGRVGNTAELNLPAAGLKADNRGRLAVDSHFKTEVEHIYAAGDVIGFPSLAATSREQGRLAMRHAFGLDCGALCGKLPYGIYSIPEISMVGPTEQDLTRQGVPYEVGLARYREIARGQILGDADGMLKILFDPDSLRVLAVHIVGEGATELIHIGQAVEAFGGTIEYFANSVFNYPTLAECYKVAALDGMKRVSGEKESPAAGVVSREM